MDNSKISSWLNSGSYKETLASALTNIISNSNFADSESATSAAFENEIYYAIRNNTGVSLNFSKEKKVSGIIHSFGRLAERKSGRGRLDAVVNNLIIEYKHHSKLVNQTDIDSAYSQVEDYLIALKKDTDEYTDAILTDGLKIAYFSYSGNSIDKTSLRPINVDDIDRIIRALLTNNTKKFKANNIVKDFSISSQVDTVTKNIALFLFNSLLDSSSTTEKTQMLYSEWKVLMHLSLDDLDDNGKSKDIEKRRKDFECIFNRTINTPDIEYKALFSLQTTFAIVVKLIACKVVDKFDYNDSISVYSDLTKLDSSSLQSFFQIMEDGYNYNSRGIRNFLEGDFFSWYSDPNQWNKFQGTFFYEFKKLIEEIDSYSAFSMSVKYDPIDIFKDLYMSMIPQSVRHSMGEYFTPLWLADSAISEALKIIDKENWCAIDPCCGSGIFILSLIKKIVGPTPICDLAIEQRNNLKNKILDSVYGIDINPLSVLSARVSYYMALSQLGELNDIEIPIYLGDSAILPSTRRVDNIDCYFYSISNTKIGEFNVILPQRLVKDHKFGSEMYKCQAYVNTDNEECVYTHFYNLLNDTEKESTVLCEHLKKLSEVLVTLHRQNWDGIWVRIATNFMMIARIKEFDLIVGNPPWVKWEHLPAAYTRKIQSLCDIKHIFCNDGLYGGAQLNICALISNIVATNWLKRDGILAFLMPDSIMSQNSYEEFRNFYINHDEKNPNNNIRLYLQKLDKWDSSIRPFRVGKKTVTQDFNTYYYGYKLCDYSAGVPVRYILKNNNNYDEDKVFNSIIFEDIIRSGFFTIKDKIAKQISNKSTAFTLVSSKYDFSLISGDSEYLFRTGVESTPFEVFKLEGVGISQKKNHYKFKNMQLMTSRYKVNVPKNGWDLPTDYIYPMVEGKNMSAFRYTSDNIYHIVPYAENNTSIPVSESEMQENGNEDLLLYFCEQRNLLEKQSEKSKTMHRGDAFYALSKIGPYTFADFIVAVRDNTSFCASVIKPTKVPWSDQPKKSLCVKHTIIISQDIEKEFISEDEAHYINGILNSSIVKEYIHSTFKTNGFSLNKAHLYIPKYVESDKTMKKIAECSKKASADNNYIEEAKETLTDLYIELCNNKQRFTPIQNKKRKRK